MPWIDVEEPYAKPPRVATVGPGTPWTPPLELDRGWAELGEVRVSADSGLNLTGCHELEVNDSSVAGLTLTPEGDGTLSVEIHRSTLDECDLSQVTVRSVRNARLTGCKLTGTDFAAGVIADTLFERCTFRYCNLRMARLNRVGFVDCQLEEVDGYQLTAEQVSTPGSRLSGVNLDGLTADRLDLREAAELSFSAVGDLSGCLVAEHQLAGMAQMLAMALGVDVERPDQ